MPFVFFDASETLIRPTPEFNEYCLKYLMEQKAPVNEQLLSRAEVVANTVYQTHRKRTPRLYSNPNSERAVWAHYFGVLLRNLCESESSDINWLDWGYDVNDFFEDSRNWTVYEDTFPSLEALRARNVRMGIISDFGDKLPSHLQHLKLTEFFEITIVSSLIGLCKYDSRDIYLHAANAVNQQPENCFMIGDSYSSDIVPAKNTGYTTVWLNRNRKNIETSAADHHINTLAELREII